MQKGKFITIDGVEGAGKSTQIQFICDYLAEKGIDVVLTREPGGTDIGEKIRHLLLSKETGNMHADTELMLMFAARCEHVHNKIIPELAQGKWVLSDRFSDSSYAYQGGGRGLDIKRIEQLDEWSMQGFAPDMTLLLDVPVELGMSRVESRGEKDRIENEQLDFFERVRQAYIDRSNAFPDRIKLIDSSQSVEHTSAQIRQILEGL